MWNAMENRVLTQYLCEMSLKNRELCTDVKCEWNVMEKTENSVLMWNAMEKHSTQYWCWNVMEKETAQSWCKMSHEKTRGLSTDLKCHRKTENSVLTWNIMEKQSTQYRCETSWKNRELSTDVKCHGKTEYTHASKIDSLQLYKLSNLVWKKNVRYRTENATFWIWILQSSLVLLVLTVRKSLMLRLLFR